jgi:hypothetical protein
VPKPRRKPWHGTKTTAGYWARRQSTSSGCIPKGVQVAERSSLAAGFVIYRRQQYLLVVYRDKCNQL